MIRSIPLVGFWLISIGHALKHADCNFLVTVNRRGLFGITVLVFATALFHVSFNACNPFHNNNFTRTRASDLPKSRHNLSISFMKIENKTTFFIIFFLNWYMLFLTTFSKHKPQIFPKIRTPENVWASDQNTYKNNWATFFYIVKNIWASARFYWFSKKVFRPKEQLNFIFSRN